MTCHMKNENKQLLNLLNYWYFSQIKWGSTQKFNNIFKEMSNIYYNGIGFILISAGT